MSNSHLRKLGKQKASATTFVSDVWIITSRNSELIWLSWKNSIILFAIDGIDGIGKTTDGTKALQAKAFITNSCIDN